jgi:hypothetical protein
MSDAKKPVARVRLYPVSAAIWRNQNEKGVFYAITFERSFRDEAGQWQTSSNFNASELLLVAKVADLAHSEIYRLRANDRTGDHSDEEAV